MVDAEHRDTSNTERFVVVPANAGPVVPLQQVDKPRGEIDLITDEVFGRVDDDGPGATDAVLVAGGLGAIVVSQLVAVPAAVFTGGIAAAALGAILPARSLIRRVKASRRTKAISSVIGNGQLLDKASPLIAELLAVYADVFNGATALGPAGELRTRGVAHGLLEEVATLLHGRPLSATETDYVQARLGALRELGELVGGDYNEVAVRDAQVAARLEVESAGASALADAHELANDLRRP